jgi:hypothetical protein
MTAKIIKFPQRLTPAVQQPQMATVVILPMIRIERHEEDITPTPERRPK